MEITLPAEMEGRLNRLAEERGRDRGSLVAEAVTRLVDHDAWFVAEVEQGLADLAQGRMLSHEDVGAQLDRKLNSRRTA
jgi:predicted transcriptional regulator